MPWRELPRTSHPCSGGDGARTCLLSGRGPQGGRPARSHPRPRAPRVGNRRHHPSLDRQAGHRSRERLRPRRRHVDRLGVRPRRSRVGFLRPARRQSGLFAAAGGVVSLRRQVPLKVALELALTGDSLSAEGALRWGLINRVVPDRQCCATALDLAERIAANAPLAVRHTKHVQYRTNGGAGWGPDWEVVDPWAVSDAAARAVFASSDAVEGARSLAEKRSPQWRGV